MGIHDGPDVSRLFHLRTLALVMACVLSLVLGASMALAADDLTAQKQGGCLEGYKLDPLTKKCVKITGIQDGPDPVGATPTLREPYTPVTDDPDPFGYALTDDITPFGVQVTAREVAQDHIIIVPALSPALGNAQVITAGKIVNDDCAVTDNTHTILEIEGDPTSMFNVFEQLARCEVQEINFIVEGPFDEEAFLRRAGEYFEVVMGACDSLAECGLRVDQICGTKGSTGKSSQLVADLASTYNGERCEGTCADGVHFVKVLCLKAKPDPRLVT